MSYRTHPHVRASAAPTSGSASVRDKGSDPAPAKLSSTVGAHAVAIAMVLLLFGSLLGPLGDTTVLMVSAGVIAIAIARSLAVHSATAWRTLLIAVALALVVALRAFYDPPMTDYGQTKWVNFVTLTFATMAAAAATTPRRVVRALAVWWVVVAFTLSVLALTDPVAATGRAQVDDSNPVWLARAMSASIVTLCWLGATRFWPWWRVVVLLPVLGAGLLATGSRGPAIASVVGVVVLLMAPAARRSQRAIWLVSAAALAAIVAPMIPAFANSRLGEFLSGGSASQESRSSLWKVTLSMIPDHPWGVGIGDWQTESGAVFPYPHNLFLEVLVEQGWLVGAALIVLVGVTLRRLWKRSGAESGLQLALALLTTETIHVSTSGDLNARTFFFVLLLAVTLLNKQRFEKARDRADPASDAPSAQVQATRPRAGRRPGRI